MRGSSPSSNNSPYGACPRRSSSAGCKRNITERNLLLIEQEKRCIATKIFFSRDGTEWRFRWYISNGVFRQPNQNHRNGLSRIGISMRQAHVKPCFATVALLAAFLSAEHLRAGQN